MPPLAQKYGDNCGLRNTTRGSVSKRHDDRGDKERSIFIGEVPLATCTAERYYENGPHSLETIIKEASSDSIHTRSSAYQQASHKENELINDMDQLLQRSFTKDSHHEFKASTTLVDDSQRDLFLERVLDSLSVETKPMMAVTSNSLDHLTCVPTIIKEGHDNIERTNVRNEACSISDPKSFHSKVRRETLQYATHKAQELLHTSKTMSLNDTSLEDLVIDSSDSFYSEFNLILRMEESSDINADLYVIHEKEEEMEVDTGSQIGQSFTSIDSGEAVNDSFPRPDSSMIDFPCHDGSNDSHDYHDSPNNSMSEKIIYGPKDVFISHLSTASYKMMTSQKDDTFETPHENKTVICTGDSDTLISTLATVSESFDGHDDYSYTSSSPLGRGVAASEPEYEVLHNQSEKYQLTFGLEAKSTTVDSKYSCFDRLYKNGKRKVQRNRELDLDRRVLEEKKSLTLEVKYRRKQAAKRSSTKPIRAENVDMRLYTKRSHRMNASGKKLRDAIAKKSILRKHERLSQFS